MKKFLKEIYPYIVIVVVVVIIRTFFITPVVVDGPSMEDTLYDNELLLLNKISYKISNIERYDIVVIQEKDEKIIKRVYGLPGEKIEYKNNKLYINDQETEDNYATNETSDFTLKDICAASLKKNEIVTEEDINKKCQDDKIPQDYYLVLGDNRKVSADSRYYGLIPKSSIVGKVSIRFWPLNKLGIID